MSPVGILQRRQYRIRGQSAQPNCLSSLAATVTAVPSPQPVKASVAGDSVPSLIRKTGFSEG